MKSFCNNCSIQGHQSYNCKMPIVSNGIIVYKTNPIQYLLICRKDSLGYVDFIRGKYSLYNKNYILNMMTQMTEQEKFKLRTLTFDAIWHDLWGHNIDLNAPENQRINDTYITKKNIFIDNFIEIENDNTNSGKSKKQEDFYLKERFYLLVNGIFIKKQFYTLNNLLDESDIIKSSENKECCKWTEPEWGFPKGRKNYQEKDLQCALREFEEETGISSKKLNIIENIMPFEEIFTGSNYKSYKHKYFLAKISNNEEQNLSFFEKGEVSKMAWFSFDECNEKIRNYNTEKRKIIFNINNIITKYNIVL